MSVMPANPRCILDDGEVNFASSTVINTACFCLCSASLKSTERSSPLRYHLQCTYLSLLSLSLTDWVSAGNGDKYEIGLVTEQQ